MTEPSLTSDPGHRSIDRPARLVLYTVFLIGSLAYTVEATTYHPLTRIAPLVVGVGASLLMVGALIQELWRLHRERNGAKQTERAGSIEATEAVLTLEALVPALKYIGVVVVYILGITLAGFLVASAVLLTALLRIGGGMRWLWIAVSIASLVVAYWTLQEFAGLTFPTGMLDLA